MASGDLNIGQRLVWGERYPFGISALNRRRHVYVIGQTGTGKSTLLTSCIAQDMAAGQGLCLIDPHGDLVNDVLDHVPPSRIDDVIVFDPTDPHYAVGWNPFYRVPDADRALVASNMVAAFRHVWQDSWGPRLEYILFNTVAALLDAPDECRATFLSVARLLVDGAYRKKVLVHVTDPRVRGFFTDEFDRWPERQVAEALGPVQNKIGQVVAHPQVRAMLCQWRPCFDLDEVLVKRRILLLRLPKGEIGADPANLTGSLLVAALLQASMRRAPASRVPFHLYIDEFQNFTTDAFSSILSESRKYGLTLTISHQYLDQLTPSVRSAVLGNVGSLIVFRVGAGDAEALADELGDVSGQALRDLLRGEVVVRLTQEAEVSQAFRGTTSVQKTSVGTREKAVAQSRRVYGRQRTKVMARISGWLQT
jgi:hypothetical protein